MKFQLLSLPALALAGTIVVPDLDRIADIDVNRVDDPNAAPSNHVTDVRLGHVDASGSGCPEGTWNADLAEDGKSVLIKLDRFKHDKDSIDCRISTKVDLGVFCSSAVLSTTSSGHAKLGDGTSANLRTSYGVLETQNRNSMTYSLSDGDFKDGDVFSRTHPFSISGRHSLTFEVELESRILGSDGKVAIETVEVSVESERHC